MKRFIMIVLGILILPGALFGYALLTYRQNRERASRFYDRPGYPHDDGTRLALAPIKTLEVLPLIDWYAARGDLETESGVSYLVRADETTMLFDLGLNRKGEQEPPLLRNMARLGVNPAEIEFVVLSHPHGDHIGGFKNQFAHRAIVWQEHDPLAGKEAVYRTLEYLKEKGIHFVALSAHDTCDWSLHTYEEAFGNEYHSMKVGERLRIKEKRYVQQTNQYKQK